MYPKRYNSQKATNTEINAEAFIRSTGSKMTYSCPLITIVYMENSTIETDVHSKVQVFPDPWISNIVLWQALTFDEFT